MTGCVIWFTGLPASGKTTLAHALQRRLAEVGVTACCLDGDVMRAVLSPRLGYTDEDRAEFYLMLARLAAELARQGLPVLVPATAHLRAYRERARSLFPRFAEVWVTTTLDTCRARDPKGLYASAEQTPGRLPGVDLPYEEPLHAELHAAGGDDVAALAWLSSYVLGGTEASERSPALP
jgi:adenylylsulfate kinase